MNDDKYLLSSVYHALEILDLLGEHELLGVADISKKLKLGKSSVFRLLYTLEAKGFVHKNAAAKYMLGAKFTYLGSVVSERQNEFSLAKPELVKLRDKLNETVHLAILLSDYSIMFIDKVISNLALQMKSRVGFKMPAYCSGSGKVLLADLLGTEREKDIYKIPLERKTPTTITDYDTLFHELRAIKAQGYGCDLEESEQGLTCFAVPILDHKERAIATVSVSGQTQRMEENKAFYLQSLKESAVEIANLLGC